MPTDTIYQKLKLASDRANAVARQLDQILGSLDELSEAQLREVPAIGAEKRDRASPELMQCISALDALGAKWKSKKFASLGALIKELPTHASPNSKLAADPAQIEVYLQSGVSGRYIKAASGTFQNMEKGEKKLADWLRRGRILRSGG